jgi:hypothetical protein
VTANPDITHFGAKSSRGKTTLGGSKAVAAGPMRPKAVTNLTWIMAALNPLGYSLLWNPNKTRSTVVLLFLVFSAMIATGYLMLWFFWKGKNWARLVVLL